MTGAAALLIVAASALWKVWPRQGQVWIEVFPWAQIVAIHDASSGETVGASCRETPCLQLLPVGRYEIELANHIDPSRPLKLEFEVTQAATTEVLATLPGFDPAELAREF